MANFWENDPIVSNGAAPWENDPVVSGHVKLTGTVTPKAEATQLPRPAQNGFNWREFIVGSHRPEQSTASNAFQSGVAQGLTANFDDEIAGGLSALPRAAINAAQGKGFDLGQAYNEGRESALEARADYQEGNEGAATAGLIMGSVIPATAMGQAGLTLMKGASPTVLSMGSRGALEGAGYGALYGFGDGDDAGERLLNAARNASLGAFIGSVAGGVGGLAAKGGQKAIPTDAELDKVVDDLYHSARTNGVPANQSQLQKLNLDVRKFLSDEGLILPTSGKVADYPALKHTLNLIDEYSQFGAMQPNQVQAVRNSIKDVLSSNDPAQRRVGYELMKMFDDFSAQISPDFAAAREMNTRLMKSREIQDLIEVAQVQQHKYSQSGLENALRTQFRQLATRIARGTSRGWAPEEVEAINAVAQGSPIANFFQTLGKWSPNGVVSQGIVGGLPTAIGGAIGGLPGAGVGAAIGGAGMGVGKLSQGIATGMTHGAANQAASLMRAGSTAPFQVSAGNSKIVQALAGAGGSNAEQVPVPLSITQVLSRMM